MIECPDARCHNIEDIWTRKKVENLMTCEFLRKSGHYFHVIEIHIHITPDLGTETQMRLAISRSEFRWGKYLS